MRRIVAAVLLLWTLPFVANAQEWTRFWPPTARCSVLTPVKLEESTEKVNDRLIGPYTFVMYQGHMGDIFYVLGWVDYGEPMKLTIQGELRANRDNLLRELGARHIMTSAITLSGNAGIHFTGETKSTLITSRVYVVGSRPYLLTVLTRKRQDRAKEIRKFLDSFSLSSTERTK